MDARFVNAVVSSLQEVFKSKVGAEVTVGKPVARRTAMMPAEVSGVIGFSGDVQGSVVFGFDRDVACRVASRFIGASLSIDSENFPDAIGALANTVAGNAQKDLVGCETSVSLPSVLIGSGQRVSQSKASPFLAFPCETSLGAFHVEIALVTKKQPEGAKEPAAAGATT